MPSPADYPNGNQVAEYTSGNSQDNQPESPEADADATWRPQRSIDVVPEPALPEKKQSKMGGSGLMKSVPENPDGSGIRPSRASQNSQKSRKSTFLKRAGTLQKVATFASHMGMDEDELNSDDGNMKRRNSDSVDDNETGTQRLQRALTKETKHKGLFRYTNTLGQSDGMEPDMLMRVSLEDEWQMVSCASLPFTIIFFVIFMGFFQQHYGITDIFLAEYPYRRVLGEEAWGIEEVGGIYDWMDELYFPYLWATQPSTPQEEQFTTSNIYSKLIGGVKLTTTRAEIRPCEDDLVTHIRCYTKKESDVDSGSSFFGRRLADSPREPAVPVRRLKRNLSLVKRLRSRARHKNIAQPAMAENTTFQRWAAFVEAEGQEQRFAHGERRQQQRRLRAHKKFRGDRKPEKDESMLPRHESFWTAVGRRLKRFRPNLKGETPDMGAGNLSSVVESASKTLTQVKADLATWESLKLLRENTLTFELEALVKNNHLGRDLLSLVTTSFTIHGSGSMFSETVVVSLIASAVSEDMFQAGLGIIFFLCLCVFSYMLPNRAWMRYKQGRLRSHFMRFWNLMEWAIILWGWIVMLFFIYERHLIWALKSSIEAYNKDTFGRPPWDVEAMDQERVPKLLDEAKAATSQSMWVQLVVSYFHIILVFRFFLASRGQPRLAIVLSTIRKAAVDLFHLFLVFIIIFLAYAVSGHMLFGRRMEEFSSFSGAFARCFQIVMEREYPWARFTEEDQWTATIWVWSFMILVVMIMVNIFLAMIFDTYGDVRSSVGHSATLWQTTKIVLAHLRHLVSFGDDMKNRRWVPNRELVQSVKAMQCVHVTPWMVKDAFPGIADKQINYLFNLAKNRLENMLVRGNKTSLPAVIASILLAVERMHNELHTITGAWSDDAMRPTVQQENLSKKSVVSETDADKPRNDSKVSRLDSNDSAFDDSPKTEDGVKRERDSKVSFSEEPVPEEPVKETRKEEPDDDFSYPAEPPSWLKVQLIPHFQKQKKLLTQVHVQIQRIDRAMHMRGIKGLPQNPETTPRALKVPFALGTPGDHMFPCGPSTATSFGGFMLPAALRQSGYENGNGSKYELLQAFAAPEQPLASPGSGRQHQSSRYSEPPSSRGPSGCCSCKPSQPLHE